MFGKTLSQYVAFQKPILILIAVVFAHEARTLDGRRPGVGRQVRERHGRRCVLGSLYYGWAVGQQGFGSFKQLYGANLVQGVFSQTLIALAIVLAIVLGQDNIYTIPEFYPPSAGNDPMGMPPDGKNFGHAIAHIVVAGAIAMPLDRLAAELGACTCDAQDRGLDEGASCPSLPASASARTRSCRRSAPAGWARCTARATRGSSATWRSRCCRSTSSTTPIR